MTSNPRTQYALSGVSNRGVASFALPLLGLGVDGQPSSENYSDCADLVALVEPDLERAAAFNAWLAQSSRQLPPLPRYDTMEELAAAQSIDAVLVTSPDQFHAEQIMAGLRHNLTVVSEKPMVTTTADARAVLAAERDSSGRLIVAHNFRYPPRHLQLKELIRANTIGRVVQVMLEYHVDTAHGSSYFVRWNREKSRSGGLTLHKSTHHLDLLGWLIDDAPTSVTAAGGTYFYGPHSPHRPLRAGAPLTGAELRAEDPYWQEMRRHGHISEPDTQARRGVLGLPYVQQYPAGREWSVYDDEIDSLDTVTSLITYSGGAAASYLVNFSSPWEGFRLVIVGTHGQLECVTGQCQGEALPGSDTITIRPLFAPPEVIPVATATGGHDGADPLLRSDIFRGPSPRSLELGLPASGYQGALAVAAGEALWRSVETGTTEMINLS